MLACNLIEDATSSLLGWCTRLSAHIQSGSPVSPSRSIFSDLVPGNTQLPVIETAATFGSQLPAAMIPADERKGWDSHTFWHHTLMQKCRCGSHNPNQSVHSDRTNLIWSKHYPLRNKMLVAYLWHSSYRGLIVERSKTDRPDVNKFRKYTFAMLSQCVVNSRTWTPLAWLCRWVEVDFNLHLLHFTSCKCQVCTALHLVQLRCAVQTPVLCLAF